MCVHARVFNRIMAANKGRGSIRMRALVFCIIPNNNSRKNYQWMLIHEVKG
jgi:hypothetical protein